MLPASPEAITNKKIKLNTKLSFYSLYCANIMCLLVSESGVDLHSGNRTPRGTITAPLPEGSCHVVTEGWEVATRD